MLRGFIVRLRPQGPWRFGPSSGAKDQVDTIFHSDSLYSAVTAAMRNLGFLEEWIAETAGAEDPAVRLSSFFPFLGDLLFVIPPRTVWPPAPSAKVRWKGSRFIPWSLIAPLLRDQMLDEERWLADPVSECLLPVEKNSSREGPFQITKRSGASVDRLGGGNVEVRVTACLEFAQNAGMWCIAAFPDEAAEARWSGRIKAAFRLLADSGIGGERSSGWGRFQFPDFGPIPDLPETAPAGPDGGSNDGTAPAYWLLSVFSPGEADSVDWTRGNYSLATRGGRVESVSRWGAPKLLTRVVEEGSVIFASTPPKGAARDVAPPDFPHPVYRAGFAVAVPVPWKTQS
ncbi:MAG: type III-A CRISPR-associated RAMP protein Csm4 [Bryobacteraceae bacterium]